MNEFSFIETLLAPLAAPGALKDDAAVLKPPAGRELVITKDALTEGVHFIGDESPELIARKALRVNLSDLAAMGAKPWGYFLALMLPESADEAWLTSFAKGLKRDQDEYGLMLMGGDTTRIKGGLAVSVTMLGLVPKGKALTRSGARIGDDVYVSGTLGDAALGLRGAGWLLKRYQLPEPRVALGEKLRGIATACMDISDGFMQDLGHICKASHVGAEIEWKRIPLSSAAKKALKETPRPYETVLAGGDDYELLFTAPAAARNKLKTSATLIGRITKAKAVKAFDAKGEEIVLAHRGWRHF